MYGLPSIGTLRPISTGNLLADVERWCRDNIPRREVPASNGTTLRLVRAAAVEATPSIRMISEPGPGWPGISGARTGS